MIKNNYIPKVTQMEKILKQWNKRSLSPIGKITVIKTLVIPIFNLLFTSLPNPNVEIYETINKTLYDFLWNKNPKIKKTVVIKKYIEGGLNMINLNAFVNALKSTWIRRLLLNESKWQELIKIHINLEMLTSCNVEYIQDILSTLNNQFWKDVLKSFLDINYETEIGEEQILKSPLFYNRNIKIDRKYVFYKTWYDKGIRFVNDLVNQNGSFYSYQEVGIDGSPLNILKYQGFIDSLKHFLSHTQIKLTKKVQDPFIPSHIKVFLQQKSGTQAMYNELNKNYDEPTSKRRWNENLTSQTKNGRKFTTTPLV